MPEGGKPYMVDIPGVGKRWLPPGVDPNDPAVRNALAGMARPALKVPSQEMSDFEALRRVTQGRIPGMEPWALTERGYEAAGAYGRANEMSEIVGDRVEVGELDRPGLRMLLAGETIGGTQEILGEIKNSLGVTDEDFIVTKDPGDPKGERDIIMVRPPGQENFVQLDSKDLITMADAAEASGVNLASALSAIGGLLTGRAGGGTVPTSKILRFLHGMRTLGGAGAGAALGVGLESMGRQVRGTEMQMPGELPSQLKWNAALGALGELPGMALAGIRGYKGFDIYRDAGEINATLTMMGAPEDMLITFSDASTIFGITARQAQVLSGGGARATVDRLENIAKFLNEKGAPALQELDKGTGAAARTLANWERQLDAALLSVPRTPTADGARAVHNALKNYADLSDAQEQLLRGQVNVIGATSDVAFHRGALKALALELARGTQDITDLDIPMIRQMLAEEIPGVAQMSDAQIRNLRTVSPHLRQILDGTRENIPVETPSRKLATLLTKFSRGVGRLGAERDLETGVIMSPYDVLFAYRKQFRAFAETADTFTDQTAANMMVTEIDNILQNPVRGGSPQLQTAITAHLDQVARTEEILDTAVARQLARELGGKGQMTPEGYLSYFFDPGRPSRVSALKRVVDQMPRTSAMNWEDIRNSYIAKLRQDPTRIEGRLDAWPEAERRLIVSQGEEATLRQYAVDRQAMLEDPIAQLAMRQQRIGKEALELIFNKDASALQRMLVHMDPDDRKALGLGIYVEGMRRSTVMVGGKEVFSPRAMQRFLEGLRTSGVIDALNIPGVNRDHLDAIIRAINIIGPAMRDDAGIALQAAGTSAGLVGAAASLDIGGVAKILHKLGYYGAFAAMFQASNPGAIRKWIRRFPERFATSYSTNIAGQLPVLDLAFWGPFLTVGQKETARIADEKRKEMTPVAKLISGMEFTPTPPPVPGVLPPGFEPMRSPTGGLERFMPRLNGVGKGGR